MQILKKKSQGALEYLLLIGGAVVVAAVVTVVVLGIGGTSSSGVQNTASNLNEKILLEGYGGNLAVNPSFELGSASWTNQSGTWGVSQNNCYSGSSCIYLPASDGLWTGVSQSINITGTDTYIVTFWRKGACVGFLYGNPGSGFITYIGSSSNGSSTDWEKQTKEVRPADYNPSYTSIRFYLTKSGSSTGVDGYCDGAIIVKKD